jgi:GTPase SAR1 family protein
MILIGTKVDLRSNKEITKQLLEKGSVPITTEEGELLAKKHGCLLYHETSALTGEGLDQLEFFKMMIQSTVVFSLVNSIADLKEKKKKCMIC